MCGFIFQLDKLKKVDIEAFNDALNNMSWRGPDAQSVKELNCGKVLLGHCRLSIMDPVERSNQPMVSQNGRYFIVFNGEIYNHLKLRDELNLDCGTLSDTETILKGYEKLGSDVFKLLDGMFAVVIYDSLDNSWVASRDAFGIKPMYISKENNQIIIGSEPSAIAGMANLKPCNISLEEWRLIRRPLPGKSYFKGVEEVMPGSILTSEGKESFHWKWEAESNMFEQSVFESKLKQSVMSHALSDVDNVTLLSGGLDSAIIAALSSVKKAYTVGLKDNNEFEGAEDSANVTGKKLVKVVLTESDIIESWGYLTRLRGEPLSLPNEALIYNVCKSMLKSEKVVLTGEGADEILFGYDGIFRWATNQKTIETKPFLRRYGYSDTAYSQRLEKYVDELKKDKTPIEFVEDFFYQVHLPGLLRRMDFSSMAASKEARVPFVNKSLIGYMYRKPWQIKINDVESKIPVRKIAEHLNLKGALNRKKIGFSAQLNKKVSRQDDYKKFQDIVMKELGW